MTRLIRGTWTTLMTTGGIETKGIETEIETGTEVLPTVEMVEDTKITTVGPHCLMIIRDSGTLGDTTVKFLS